MAELDVFQLADRALARFVARIASHQWEMILLATFTTRARPEPPSSRTLINYHAFDDAWVPDMLAGLTMDEAGSDKFDGDLPRGGSGGQLRGHGCPGLRGGGRGNAPHCLGAPVVRRLPPARVLLADQPVPAPAGLQHRRGHRCGP